MLIILSGLPGTGKTTLARAVARKLHATHIRIDSIEDVLRDSGPLDDRGYRIAYAVAEDNLRAGQTVIADCVNPIELTREAWRQVATRTGVPAVEIEVICSDLAAHRRRVELRGDEFVAREYDPWTRDRLVVDTSTDGVEQAADRIVARALG